MSKKKFKFGDIVRCRVSGVAAVVWHVHKDKKGKYEYLADTAFGAYGFDGKRVAHSYSRYSMDELINLHRRDVKKAIEMQLFYTQKSFEYYKDKTNDEAVLLKNYMFDIGKLK